MTSIPIMPLLDEIKPPFNLQVIYVYITAFWLKHGYSPSVRDIRDACNLSSTSVVNFYLDKLKDKGLIHFEGRKARTIIVVGSRWIPPQLDINLIDFS